MYMYPQSNSARSVRDLSGVWDFRFNANEPWQPIAVPASYNDQSPDPEFRRHYGMAYYRTTFTVPEGARRVLRFDAVTHNAVVRLNGQEVSQDWFAPGWTEYASRLQYQVYDVTALIQPENTLEITTANGWYAGYLNGTRQVYGKQTAIFAELSLTCMDKIGRASCRERV